MSDDFLGFNFRIIAAGFSGGVVGAYFAYVKKQEPWRVVASIIIGGLAANYMSPPISYFLGTPSLLTAFVVGMAWKEICILVIAFVKDKTGKAFKE
jgi:hypothetical protein